MALTLIFNCVFARVRRRVDYADHNAHIQLCQPEINHGNRTTSKQPNIEPRINDLVTSLTFPKTLIFISLFSFQFKGGTRLVFRLVAGFKGFISAELQQQHKKSRLV